MKTFWIIIITAFVTIAFTVTLMFFLWASVSPVHRLLQTSDVKRVDVKNRTLESVVSDIVGQVKVKNGAQLRVIFSPPSLGKNTMEMSGGVFGNPPVEGEADEALGLVADDYRCRFSYNEDGVILFYQ